MRRAAPLVMTEVEQRLSGLKNKVSLLREQKIAFQLNTLLAENEQLKSQVLSLSEEYRKLQRANGRLMPDCSVPNLAKAEPPASPAPAAAAVSEPVPPAAEETCAKKEKPAGKKKADKPQPQQSKGEEKPVDVSRLDLRVGRIVEVGRHPDADGLYVEQIDLGEQAPPRTVCSGLVKWMGEDALRDRLAVVLCNLKPVKMRGVSSEAMVMCASGETLVELLDPPAGSVPGDRVACDAFPGQPDPQLNPKKKVLECVLPDLRVDQAGVATYKGAPLSVPGKGTVTSNTARDSLIK